MLSGGTLLAMESALGRYFHIRDLKFAKKIYNASLPNMV